MAWTRREFPHSTRPNRATSAANAAAYSAIQNTAVNPADVAKVPAATAPAPHLAAELCQPNQSPSPEPSPTITSTKILGRRSTRHYHPFRRIHRTSFPAASPNSTTSDPPRANSPHPVSTAHEAKFQRLP